MKESDYSISKLFSDDIKEELELDLMMGIASQVGDQIDQVAGLGSDELVDKIIATEAFRSEKTENFGLFNEKSTIESIEAIKENLEKMKNNLNALIEDGVDKANFSDLKEYVSMIGKLDKDIYYAAYNNRCLSETVDSLKEILECYKKTEEEIFDRNLPFMEQHIIVSRESNGLNEFMIMDVLDEVETKLDKRTRALNALIENSEVLSSEGEDIEDIEEPSVQDDKNDTMTYGDDIYAEFCSLDEALEREVI